MRFVFYLNEILAFIGLLLGAIIDLFSLDTLDKTWFHLSSVVSLVVAGYISTIVEI